MTRTPFVSETARSPQYISDENPLGQPVMATTDFVAVDLASSGGVSGGAATGSNGDVMMFTVAPQPEGATFAWTVTGGTATIDPVAADTESVSITFSSVATFTVQCEVTVAGDADSPKTVTKEVVIS